MAATILRIACACAMVLLGCAKSEGDGPAPPAGGGEAGGDVKCPRGGPSVSIDVRGHAGGDVPQNELGALLGWIGGFAEPCRKLEPEADRFTLFVVLGEEGEAPQLELAERDELPGLAACLDENFAKVPPPPPPGSMNVAIVVPWGCSTLGPGFDPTTAPRAPVSESALTR
jgi:hypothetical protein